ncbi:phage integrase, N-terminal SAM domain protein [Anaerococcus hydrogenalis ACS-025-V-Sch4]|uniref:Phage integrase, N-terminal SAM domain protein n=1 Tax=Anaerococcus hydrogenalis ACS-025-V-Sch4 TaxID=879306 RepID=F0GZH4_9FIRM|nr:phage integrase, N-terminal SAM domain protein [Anaerococcus hydrogenalis ACS-025-V-Sch4]
MNITTPLILDDYLSYLKSIRALSEKTISEYRYDLINFIYYQILRKVYFNDKENLNKDIEDENININKIFNKSFISDINIQDMYSYISYLDNELNDNASTRSRKISALRSFYKYLHQEIEIIDNNITEKLRNPKIQKRQPVYLTLSETEHLLDTINEEKNEFLRNRDMAIVFTFLTTGMRLSELVSVDLKDIKDDHFTIIGKGNKERTIYLTKNCIDLIDNYIMIRKNYLKDIKIDALFISTRKKEYLTGLFNLPLINI